MKVNSKITLAEYRQVMFQIIYNVPMIRVLNIIGAATILFYSFHFAGISIAHINEFPTTPFVIALLIVFGGPLMTYVSAKKKYDENPHLKEEVTYEIINGKLIVSGASFSEEKDLKKILLITETKKWFILNETNWVYNFIRKNNVTKDELILLRDMLGKLDISGVKKLEQSTMQA